PNSSSTNRFRSAFDRPSRSGAGDMQGIESELSLRRNPDPPAQPGLLPMLPSDALSFWLIASFHAKPVPTFAFDALTRADAVLPGKTSSHVITGLVPVIPSREAQNSSNRDGRGEPGHDEDVVPDRPWNRELICSDMEP
ncbi:hypothetical protein, partial [Microvirga tunisiensis]|uniref:hypothetical protein n=1 Tax=Microvirga tunisiensis TaxID=2108360 RepID=UPI001AED6EF8